MKKRPFAKKKEEAILFAIIAALILCVFISIAFLLPIHEKPIEPIIPQSSNYFFSLIVLPDTQKYSANNPEIFLAQTNWIAENKEALNIIFVAHVGDLVDSAKDKNQWINAKTAMNVLTDNNIPFGIALGNHDYNSFSKRVTPFEDYFKETDFGESLEQKYPSEGNGYAIINIKDFSSGFDKNITFVFASFCPESETLNQLSDLLEFNNSEKIFITHGYLGADKNRYVHVCKSTEYIWNDFVKKQVNMDLVLSGHVHFEAIHFSKNDFNQDVIEVLSDYQSQDKQKSGYLKILTFYPGKEIMDMRTFSPYKNDFFDSNIDGLFPFEIN